MTEPERVLVRLVKPHGTDVAYPATLLADDGTHVVVEAPWVEPAARDLRFVRFEPGDVFTEHYWRDRWYSIKDVRRPDGRRKGWYCDVARPVVVAGGELVSEDLDLDLWVAADRRTVLRLDEEEFAARDLDRTDPEAAAAARAALDELERLAVDGWAGVPELRGPERTLR